jgi:hypothetical protein
MCNPGRQKPTHLILSDKQGEFYCLEVNPMPGYHGYDHQLNFAISDSLGALLSTPGSLAYR